jgi:gliding motility associated protien GldN
MNNYIKITSISVLMFLLSIGTIYSQDTGEPQVLDGAWVKHKGSTKRLVPYTHVREDDVMWSKRIWRQIDLKEKINFPLYYPITPIADRKSLFEVIKNGIEEGTITAYDDDEFKVSLTKAEAKNKMGGYETRELYDEYGEQIGADSIFVELESQDIMMYNLKEDWFFDRERSVMDVRIIGMAPVKQVLDDEGNLKGYSSLFWIYFPQARYVFVNYEAFNRHNDSERRTFDDIFWKRMFSSYIQKESNVYDRMILHYKQGMDILLEGEKIKEVITNYEHDLWHF